MIGRMMVELMPVVPLLTALTLFLTVMVPMLAHVLLTPMVVMVIVMDVALELHSLQRHCHAVYHRHFSKKRVMDRWHEELCQLLTPIDRQKTAQPTD